MHKWIKTVINYVDLPKKCSQYESDQGSENGSSRSECC